ncbi:hypothetical protein [Tropicimonas sp. IMCC34043]|uniref:hypothetical protein n=1 Tax=Tropicimonas sp. IMCC34043 TaxID=2248760 RepID=UPI001E5FB423|nr:hypothetical protein [Tropicimonas sp. IMCC34043]
MAGGADPRTRAPLRGSASAGQRVASDAGRVAAGAADGTSPPTLFVARDLYRRRRIMDAARLLPAFGTVLVLLPILWAREHGTANGAVYLFLVWAVLVLAAAILARRLSEPLRERGQAGRVTDLRSGPVPGAADGAPPDEDGGGGEAG